MARPTKKKKTAARAQERSQEYAQERAQKEAAQALAAAAKKLFSVSIEPLVSRSAKPEFGDLSSAAAFEIAKTAKRNPVDIAKKLAAETAQALPPLFSSVAALGPYVNFVYSNEFYAALLDEVSVAGEVYGSSESGARRRVVVDYSSPNIGKPMHVGHIRSTILGDSVCRLLRFTGCSVVGSNYLCEAGTQTAKLMLALHELEKRKLNDEKDLLDYYVKIHKRIEENPELLEKARVIVEDMENGEVKLKKELAEVRRISVDAFDRNYALLGVSFEETIFDSDMVPLAKRMALELLDKKIAFRDKDGEIVGDLEKFELPNLIVLRSNGTTLYSTRDLALAETRFQAHKFTECVYVTGSEQKNHFNQVFKILDLLGKPYAAGLKHVSFGLISLPSGKMSTRQGNVVLLEDILNAVIAEAQKEILKRRGADYSESEIGAIAKQIGVGSTRFAFLRVSPEKNIVFDPAAAVVFEGDTGAYVQYALVRCRSILAKAAEVGLATKIAKSEFGKEEKALLALAAEFPLAVESAARAMQPHQACDFLLKFCAAFNAFYAACPVLSAENDEDKVRRLRIVDASLRVIENGLGLLGISAPEKM
ncbi:MAG: arginine--tRNA ligase [Candidatus Micrarchaeota archaeon]